MSTAIQTNPKARRGLKPQVPDFCPVCDAVDHPFKLVNRRVIQEFREETFEVPAPAMRCGNCNFELAIPGQLDALRLAVAQAYRLRHKLLTSEEIIGRRRIMGMAQKAFADYTGVGVASLQRWEKGLMVQDKGSDLLIRERTRHTEFTSPAGGDWPAAKPGRVTVRMGHRLILPGKAREDGIPKRETRDTRPRDGNPQSSPPHGPLTIAA